MREKKWNMKADFWTVILMMIVELQWSDLMAELKIVFFMERVNLHDLEDNR